MRWLIYRLLLRNHKHKWNVLKKYFGGSQGTEWYFCQCEKCGRCSFRRGNDI